MTEPNGEKPARATNQALERIRERVARGKSLSRKHGLLADFLLSNTDQVAFMTAAELARAAGVSEATVIRFATELSFSGYPDFQREFQQMVTDRLSTVRRLRNAVPSPVPIHQLLEEELNNLQATVDQLVADDIDRAAKAVLEAEVLYVVGLRGSSCLAAFFAYQASEIAQRVVAITRGGADSLQEIQPTDRGVLVAFAFRRYPRETVELVDAARELGMKVVGITDSYGSPLAQKSDIVLLAHSKSPGFVDLLGAPMLLSAAILDAVGRLDETTALQRLARFEAFAERSNLFWSGR